MVKTNKGYYKTYREKKRDVYPIKDAARKRSKREKRKCLYSKKHNEFKKKEAVHIKEYLLKKKLAEQFACDSQKETRKATFHFIIVFFETNPELKYKKGRRIAQTKPARKSRSNRQPCQEIQMKDSSAKKQSRKGEEQIESEGKRVARELFGKSKYNLHNARQMRYCLCRNGSR